MVSGKNISIVTAASLVILAIVIGSVGVLFLIDFLKYDRYQKHDFIDSSTYQAVFLTNDQIYFGHLKNISSDYLILHDVYYVRVDESSVAQIVKLGIGEPHGPQDKMIINQDQVLFWENLKFDSTVVQTIQNM